MLVITLVVDLVVLFCKVLAFSALTRVYWNS